MISIITPYYNVLEYTKKLAEVLEPQLNEQVEWIVIDDGCNELELDKLNAKVIHLEKNSGCASVPRNVGLDNAKGEYITFIDADDLVADNYVETIINKCKEDFDYCLFSWRSQGVWNANVIIEDNPPSWNCSVWNCIYKKSNIRFDETLKIGEDFKYNQEARKGKKANIKDILYIYNSGVENSLTSKGVVYNDR